VSIRILSSFDIILAVTDRNF